MSLNRAPRRLAVLALAVLAAFAASVATAAVASAHVSVSSTDAAAGGFGKLTFRVPNESDTASTVKLRIQIPEEAALASLSVQPVQGWTVTVTRSDLPEPVETDDGESVTSYVSVVEFRAADGGGIGPGQFQEFSLSGGPFPDAESVSFPTVQTYSDGTETAWIEPTVGGQEPEHPAPTLTLTASGGAASATDPAATASESEDSSWTAVVALVVAILALVVAVAAGVLGWRASRRTVSS